MDFKRLDQFIDTLAPMGIPGGDIKVMYKGQEVYRRAFGYADRENGIPISSSTLYFLYSASKVATVTAGMQMLERGKFLLSEPITNYLPEFKDMQVCYWDRQKECFDRHPARRIATVQDLFAMSGGFNYNLNTDAIRRVVAETDGRAPTREVIRALSEGTWDYDPHEHFGYSLCHDVLACLIEVVSGQRFADYMKENIFAPLGMEDTYYHVTPEIEGRIAQQYRYNDATKTADLIAKKNDYVIGSEYDSGGAGIISSVNDYSKFVWALANGGVGKTGERILSRRAIDLMRTNVYDEARLKEFHTWPQMVEYGYGLGVRTMMKPGVGGSLSSVGEFGWGGAAGAYVMVDPDAELSVFYAQHMLNNLEPYTHPRFRNIIYGIIDP
jgi:CubicO group peptidase (beta-lactamase class C family)